jgi:hypothetical protein
MRDLLVVVPSRGRPASIERLWDAMAGTCRGDTTLLVGLDDDDPELGVYPAGPEREVRPGLRQVVAWINALAVPRAGAYRFTGTIGDDNVPRTEGWDVSVMEALEKAPFAFGNDLYPTRPPGSLCCHVFCRSGVIEALGYFGPPSIRHMYVDPVWYAWGQATAITYLPGVIIEHLHYTTGKSPHDASYAASCAWTGADLAAYHAYCAAGLNEDIAKLGGRPFTPESLADFNRALNIPPSWP